MEAIYRTLSQEEGKEEDSGSFHAKTGPKHFIAHGTNHAASRRHRSTHQRIQPDVSLLHLGHDSHQG